MAIYQEARVKVTNTRLNKSKSAAKNKTGTKLRSSKQNFEDKKFPHELFLITKKTTKIRNAFSNKMSTNIKLSKTKISKIIQLVGPFCSLLANSGKEPITNVAIPLARNNLPGLVSNLTSSAINKFDRK